MVPCPRTESAHQICIDEVCANMADFLPTRSVLKVCLPVCLLNSGEVEQIRKSKEIDRCLSREKTYVKRLVKILLLGAGESGKSTFLKQMRIIHGQDFDQDAREEFRATIYSNVIKGKHAAVGRCALRGNESPFWRGGKAVETEGGKFAHLLGEERHKQPTSAPDTPNRAGLRARSLRRPPDFAFSPENQAPTGGFAVPCG